eukprot:4678618-Pyramimonas_sp.AAC.1
MRRFSLLPPPPPPPPPHPPPHPPLPPSYPLSCGLASQRTCACQRAPQNGRLNRSTWFSDGQFTWSLLDANGSLGDAGGLGGT